MLKVRVVATVFATVLAVSLTACGSHQSADTAAAQSGASSAASSGAQGSSPSKSSGSSAGSSTNQGSGAQPRRDKGARAAAGHLPKGSYDDTTGTRARHPKSQNAVLSQLPGASTSRGCVAVGNRTDVRARLSSRWATSPMPERSSASAKNAYVADESFFYVIPSSRSVGRVTVTATRLGRAGAPVRATSTARGAGGSVEVLPDPSHAACVGDVALPRLHAHGVELLRRSLHDLTRASRERAPGLSGRAGGSGGCEPGVRRRSRRGCPPGGARRLVRCGWSPSRPGPSGCGKLRS